MSNSFVTPWTVACKLLYPWGFPGKNTRVGCHFLLQEISWTQRLNSCLLNWQANSLPLSHLGSLYVYFQFSCSVMSNSATPWTAARQASPSITNSRSLLKLTSIELVMPFNISSSVIPFSSCLKSFPASDSFPTSQFFTSRGQGIGASASVSVLPMNIQGWFTLRLTGLISLQFKGLSRVFLTPQFKSMYILQQNK